MHPQHVCDSRWPPTTHMGPTWRVLWSLGHCMWKTSPTGCGSSGSELGSSMWKRGCVQTHTDVLQTHWILNNSKYYYKNTSIYKTSQRPQYDALVYVNLQERVQFPKDLGPQSPLFMEHLPHVPWHKCGQCWPETKLTVRTPAGCNLASLILTLLIPMILNQRLACSFLKRNITLTHLGMLMLMCLTHSPITSLLIICFSKINPSIYPSIILSIHMLIPV